MKKLLTALLLLNIPPSNATDLSLTPSYSSFTNILTLPTLKIDNLENYGISQIYLNPDNTWTLLKLTDLGPITTNPYFIINSFITNFAELK